MPPKKQPDLKAIEHAVKEVFSLVSAMSNAVARVEDAQESSVKDLDEIREETFALKSKMNDLSTSLNDAASVPGSSTNQDQVFECKHSRFVCSNYDSIEFCVCQNDKSSRHSCP
ncbi:hypothetical protein BJV82DRAFT_189375 [Fennellomyces sp. T-0311]|nr:hypothetical protein BJV82DRAFT_189375 [Fennellomyces sp. T-0311]